MSKRESLTATGVARSTSEHLALFYGIPLDHPVFGASQPFPEVLKLFGERIVVTPPGDVAAIVYTAYQPMFEWCLRDAVLPVILEERRPLFAAWLITAFGPRAAEPPVEPDAVVFDSAPLPPPGGGSFGWSNGPRGNQPERYQRVRLIGYGTYGYVYEAYDTLLKRTVAMKEPRPEFLSACGAEAFLVEPCLAAQINHPNVCSIYDVVDRPGAPFFVMELLEGGSLYDELNARAVSFAVSEAAQIVRALAEGVQAAHDKCIVHADLKPKNVFRRSTGEYAIGDFSVAMTFGAAGCNVGTPAYQAPEQRGQFVADPKCDVYALGRILHELLALERPTNRDPLADIDSFLAELILRATHPDLRRRPTAGELAQALGLYC